MAGGSDLRIYRRQLPHWRQRGSTYFVTWRLERDQPPLTPPERRLVVDSLLHFDGARYDLHTYVVMDDHVHTLVTPIAGAELEHVVHGWKSFTTNQLRWNFRRENRVWQREYFDRIVRDESEFMEKAHYILGNPHKRWPELDDYPWVGLRAS